VPKAFVLGALLAAASLVSGRNGPALAAEEGAGPAVNGSGSVERRTIDSGYVFIDGQYLPPPYEIEETEEGVLINGLLVKADQFPQPSRPGGPGLQGVGFRGGPWHASGRSFSPTGDSRRFAGGFFSLPRRVAHRLESEAAIIAFADRPLLILEAGPMLQDLFRVLADRDPDSTALNSVVGILPVEADRDQLADWLATYQPPAELAAHARSIIERAEAVAESNMEEIAAVRRIDRFAYPLTVAGMVLAVLASGHLLKTIPSREPRSSSESSPQLMRFVLISAALVFCLSSLDLIWTVLAADANQIRELNPLGNRLIDKPQTLVAFKLSATLVSCALLVALRRYPSAQVASWWLCLVCTMLTFRWLLFNSMFLGT
jgi:hypothetical protein